MVKLVEIEEVFKQRNWWDLLVNLFITKHLTYFIANNTRLTPNQITFISLVLAVFAGVGFYFHYYILGAILYQVSYIFDIVDGALARVTKQTSKFGAFFDVFTDWLKAPILIIILLWSSQFYLVAILFLLFLNCSINKYNDMLFYTLSKSVSSSQEVIKSRVGKYFEYMKNKHIQPLAGIIEFEALVLFFYPIFEYKLFLFLGVFLLSFNFILKFYVVMKKLK